MQYNDKVYGEVEILEPVILELIESNAIQRLKGIDQYGYLEPYFKGAKTSRYSHSLGVFLLLKKFGAPLEEQISGLIHDVSHTAFSHCIDYILEGGSFTMQDFQDKAHDNFVKNSDIPKILEKYNIDINYILNDDNFPLKETSLPDLCADRIDYSMRDATTFNELPDPELFIKNLSVINNMWVFNNFDIAKKYSEFFIYINNKYYSGVPTALMFITLGDYLKYSLENKYIEIDDLLLGTDASVLSKIEPFINSDQKLSLLHDRMNAKIGHTTDPNNYDRKLLTKSRAVDPLFKHGDKIIRVSDLDADFKITLANELKPKEHYIKFDK